MEQSSLNNTLWDAMYEHKGEFLHPDEAANIAEKTVKEIAIEFATHCLNEQKDIFKSTLEERFNQFLILRKSK